MPCSGILGYLERYVPVLQVCYIILDKINVILYNYLKYGGNMKCNIFLILLLFMNILLFAQNQNDFEYTSTVTNGKQGIIITKYIGNNVNVIIPENINGIPVTVIGENSFEQTNIKTIEMSDSIISIGNRAFRGCQELITVKISASVLNFGRYSVNTAIVKDNVGNGTKVVGQIKSGTEVLGTIETISGVGGELGNYGLDLIFDGCSKLTSINVDLNNPNYSSIDGVLFNKQMTILLFFPHGKEGNYNIPNSVIEIGEGAFFNCKQLTSVSFPDKLIRIGMFNFFFCSSIKSFNVDLNNENFISEDGVLYNKNKEKLVRFPSGKTGFFQVPEYVKIIGHGAFFSCSSGSRIYIVFENIIRIEHGGLGGFNFGNSQQELATRFPGAFDLPMDIVFLYDGGA